MYVLVFDKNFIFRIFPRTFTVEPRNGSPNPDRIEPVSGQRRLLSKKSLRSTKKFVRPAVCQITANNSWKFQKSIRISTLIKPKTCRPPRNSHPVPR